MHDVEYDRSNVGYGAPWPVQFPKKRAAAKGSGEVASLNLHHSRLELILMMRNLYNTLTQSATAESIQLDLGGTFAV